MPGCHPHHHSQIQRCGIVPWQQRSHPYQFGARSPNPSPSLALALALAPSPKESRPGDLKGSTNEDSQDIGMDIEAEILLQPPLTDKEAGQALLQGRKAVRKLYSRQLRATSHLEFLQQCQSQTMTPNGLRNVRPSYQNTAMSPKQRIHF